MGPDIQPEDIQELFNQLDDLTEKDILVISGSIPSTLPDTMYEQIMERVQKKKIKVVVDATNNLLLKVLKYKPFLIKPNNHELGEIFNVELNTRDEVIPYAKKLQEMGAQNVLISMAGQGAVLVSDNNEVIQSKAPKGEVVNSVGAGDSMVAGFLAGYLETTDYDKAFINGLCCGSASAFQVGLATKEDVENIKKTLSEN